MVLTLIFITIDREKMVWCLSSHTAFALCAVFSGIAMLLIVSWSWHVHHMLPAHSKHTKSLCLRCPCSNIIGTCLPMNISKLTSFFPTDWVTRLWSCLDGLTTIRLYCDVIPSSYLPSQLCCYTHVSACVFTESHMQLHCHSDATNWFQL